MTLEEVKNEIRKRVSENKSVDLFYPDINPDELILFLFKEYEEHSSIVLKSNPAFLEPLSFGDWKEIVIKLENEERALKALLRFLYIYLKVHSVEIFMSLDTNEANREKVSRFFNKSQHAFFSTLPNFKVDDSLINIGVNLMKQGAPAAIEFEAILKKI